MALLKLGYSGNTTDPKEIEAAYHELQKLMPNVLAFNSDNPGNPFMEGSQRRYGVERFGLRGAPGRHAAGDRLAEGRRIFWMDSLAIPANARNVEGR